MVARLTDPPKAMQTELRRSVFQIGERMLFDMNHHPVAVVEKEDEIHVYWAVRVKEEA